MDTHLDTGIWTGTTEGAAEDAARHSIVPIGDRELPGVRGSGDMDRHY